MLKLSLRPLAFAALPLLGALIAPPSVLAGTPSGAYAPFQHCPYRLNPNAQSCFVATISAGSFKIGNATVPINKTIVLQGGVQTIFLSSPVYEAVGTSTISPTALDVPGGLLGLMQPALGWPGLLVQAFWNVVNSANGVTATAEAAGPATAYLSQAIFPPLDGSDPTVVHLPLKVHLRNPFLGDSCYIGSDQHPIMLNLTVTTTNPPPPNQPITGVPATFRIEDTTHPAGSIIHADNSTLVDNSFAVPAASGCGNTLLNVPIITPILQILISEAVNLKEGLPATAGKNTVIMTNSTAIAPASYVEASEQ